MFTVIDNDRFRKLLSAYPRKAVKLLHDLYSNRLLNLARSLTHDPIVSEDIVQEAFLSVWEKRKELSRHHDTSFEHYLVRIVRNKSITHYKNSIKHSIELSNLLKKRSNGNTNSVEKEIMHAEFIEEVRNVILTFPRAERDCLLMNIFDEMSVDQIADHQKVTRKAIERSLTSARKRLRKWLAK